MRRKSFALALVLTFCISFLVPAYCLSSQVRADTTGWYLQDAGTTGPLNCVSAVDSETIWAGGYVQSGSTSTQGLILRSVDGGNTWTQSLYPTTPPVDTLVAFAGMSGIDADTAWAGGTTQPVLGHGSGFFLGTSDGGASWNMPGSFWGSIYCLSAVDAQTAWAAGYIYPTYPVVMKTTDGANWSLAYGEATYSSPLYGVSAVDANTVWAVGTGGMILKTVDGTNWAHQDFPTANNLRGVSAVDSSTAWAVGDGGVILHTTDGTSWSQQDSGVTSDLTGVSAFDASTAWAVGKGGTILKTNDSGATWTPQTSGIMTNLNGVSAVDPNTAWAVGDDGVVLHSTDGGAGQPVPYIKSVAPDSGPEGIEVTVEGSGFMNVQGSSFVSFGSVQATEYDSWSDTEVKCRVPSMSPGTAKLTVRTDYGTSNPFDFNVIPVPAPEITSMTPSFGVENTVVDITDLAGTGFNAGATVRIEKTGTTVNATDVNVVSATQVTCKLNLSGAPLGKYDVVVKNPDAQEGTLAYGFTVNNPTPTITTISPTRKTAGDTGFTFTVNGTNFVSGSVVSWNRTDRTTTYVSDTQLTAAITASDIATAGTASVTVFNPVPGGGTSTALTFTINPVPTPNISSISPTRGPVGTAVIIKGTSFGTSRGGSYVSFGGRKCSSSNYISWNNTQIRFKVPSGATTGPVTVTTDGGTSNGKQFTVNASTPPAPTTTPTWYLAEGTTAWGFSTYITIENPNASTVKANVTYMPTGKADKTEAVSLPPNSQTTLTNEHLVSVMGGASDFSTKILCLQGKTIAVDRTMSWTGPGAASPEAHSSVGVTSPARAWYLPEGSSAWGFECWLLIQNPNSKAADCKVTYMIENVGPRTFTKTVPANSRATFDMSKDIGAADASIKVESNVPVIPERAMYRNNRREGHDSIGTTTPAKDYYLAEGATGYNVGYITYVLVQNPNTTPTNVNLTYMTQSGEVAGPSFQMPANSRKTVRVNDQLLPGTDVSTHVHGTQPIIAERAMYWNNGTGEACHDSIGMASPHAVFYLPDGETGNGYETWTLVQNPNSADVTVEVTYMTPTGKGNVVKTETVKGNSRRTFSMAMHSGINGRAAIMVTSKTSGKKVMVERAMYWNSRGAGTDTIGGYGD
jgi:photosystem II stability/assembly factor-like uncharacterized protein